MKTEVLLHVDENLDAEARQKLIASLCDECGGSKPHFVSNKPHQIFVGYNQEKISLHDIPRIAKKHGVHVEIIS